MDAKKPEYICQSCHQSFKNTTNHRLHVAKAMSGALKRCDGTRRPIHKARKSDQYNTPDWMWCDLVTAFPALRDTLVWDPFLNDDLSVSLMRAAGMKKVKVQTGEDFFKVASNNQKHLIVANPPFSLKRRIIQKLMDIDRPFILLLPIAVMYVGYFKPILRKCKVIVPHKQCIFKSEKTKKTINVPSAFFCYKTGPAPKITYC